jgi:hypothetical protein
MLELSFHICKTGLEITEHLTELGSDRRERLCIVHHEVYTRAACAILASKVQAQWGQRGDAGGKVTGKVFSDLKSKCPI